MQLVGAPLLAEPVYHWALSSCQASLSLSILHCAQVLDRSNTSTEVIKRSNQEQSANVKSGTKPRTRIRAVVNVGRVELEMLRTLKQHRSIEPLARFQARLLIVRVESIQCVEPRQTRQRSLCLLIRSPSYG